MEKKAEQKPKQPEGSGDIAKLKARWNRQKKAGQWHPRREQ